MDYAVQYSIDNVKNNNGGPFAAIIVKDGKIISKGVNCVVKDNDPTAHAEIVAIRKACKELNTYNLSGCILYSSCEACPMCYAAIRWARIDEIYYSNTRDDAANIGFIDSEIYDEIQNKKMKMVQMLHPKAIQAFQLWNEDSQNIKY